MSIHRPNIERLLAALRHEKLDRVPNFEIILDPRAVSHILGRQTDETLWTLPPADAVRVVEAVGQDAVVGSLTWMIEPDGSILTAADLDAVTPPDPKDARAKLQGYLDAIAGTDVGLVARVSGPLTLTYMALGPVPIESFMYQVYDNLPLVERLMDMFVDYHVRVIEAVADMPFHLFYIGDDLSSSTGPMISPTMLGDLWAPRCERLVRAAQSTGRPIIFHCCGDQSPILPYLARWGVNATHPIQPEANDIYQIHADFGDALTLVGNIDVAGPLSFGTADEVRAETREHIDRLAGTGGYIACSSHSIIDSVIPENYLAMVETVHEYGVF